MATKEGVTTTARDTHVACDPEPGLIFLNAKLTTKGTAVVHETTMAEVVSVETTYTPPTQLLESSI
jgi:hypothetical protein